MLHVSRLLCSSVGKRLHVVERGLSTTSALLTTKSDVFIDSKPTLPDPKPKAVDAFIHPEAHKRPPTTIEFESKDEVMDISGVPEEHQYRRRARIFKPAREATQSGWNNTKLWKVELDTRDRWENPLIGWSSNSDPLSNIGANMEFASSDAAVRFCEKNRWEYELIEPQVRKLRPTAYGDNFSWNKKTRVGTK